MIGAPAFDGERRAVVGEEIGVERLEKRQRFKAAGKLSGQNASSVADAPAIVINAMTAVASRATTSGSYVFGLTVSSNHALLPLRLKRARARRASPPIRHLDRIAVCAARLRQRVVDPAQEILGATHLVFSAAISRLSGAGSR